MVAYGGRLASTREAVKPGLDFGLNYIMQLGSASTV